MMNKFGQRVLLAGISTLTLGLASPAMAQQIHTYGEVPQAAAGTTQGASAQTTGAANMQPSGEAAGQPGESAGEDSGEFSGVVRMSSGSRFNNLGARETLDLTLDKLYRGVIPGMRDTVAHLSKAQTKGQNQANRNELTWLGFEPTDDYTRVFFQTARKADYNILRKQNPAQIEVTLSNTEIAARNFGRFIDTRYFGRNVRRVEATQLNASTLKIIIELEKFAQPTVRESDNYIYLDFPNDSAQTVDATSAQSAKTPD